MVVVSDEGIASPYIDKPDTLFVFNQPSWDKFKSKINKKGLALVNSTLIEDKNRTKDINVCAFGFTKIASDLGQVRVANMVALGKYLKEKKILNKDSVFEVFAEVAPKSKKHLIEVNKKAIEAGYNL